MNPGKNQDLGSKFVANVKVLFQNYTFNPPEIDIILEVPLSLHFETIQSFLEYIWI